MDSSSASPTPALPVVDFWCDLQCPDCHRAQADIEALRRRYGGELEVRLRHFPLAKHAQAYAAAQAAEEAYAQGAQDAYVAAVLARTAELGSESQALLLRVARELDLDAEEFETALIDGRHLLLVDADQAEGKAMGVRGTPTYVVAGELLDGSSDQSGLRERIEEILDAART